jgi:Leucine-rich repeat (LRR) protein
MGAVHCCLPCGKENQQRDALWGSQQRATAANGRLPNDVVQNVVEYLDTVQAMWESRLVALDWRTATAYAVGFLNGRCWDIFSNERDGCNLLSRHFLVNRPATAHAFGIICLGPMLKVLRCRLPLDIDLNVVFRSCPALVELSIAPTAVSGRRLCSVDGRPLRSVEQPLRLDVQPCLYLQALNISSWRRVVLLTGVNGCLADVRLSRTAVDANSWFRRVLPRLTSLDLSFCEGCADLSLLRRCASLQELNLNSSDSSQAAVVTLVGLKALQVLNLCGCAQVTDLRELQQCRNLTDLKLSNSGVSNSSLGFGFVPLPSLVSLDLHSWTGSANVVPKLRDGCVRLGWLDLSHSDADDHCVSVLGAMRALETLLLNSCKNVTSASALTGVRTLSYLSLSDTRVSSTGIAGLETLPLLATLRLDGTPVDDIRCLQSCPVLTSLDLGGGSVRDVVPLAQIISLRTLSLLNTQIADVSTLANNLLLETLSLGGTRVTAQGINGLQHLPALRKLSLAKCRFLHCVTALCASGSLEELDLDHCRMTQEGVEGIETIASLQLLHFRGVTNPVTRQTITIPLRTGLVVLC